MSSIGIAIPTYSKHIQFLNELLESIEQNTIKPTQVVVSISSMQDYENDKIYSYPIKYLVTSDYKNPSMNRNIAKSHLNTDIISFIDGDDVMHCKRLEYIKTAFSYDPYIDIVMHNFIGTKHFSILEQNLFNNMYEKQIEPYTNCYKEYTGHKPGWFETTINWDLVKTDNNPYKINGMIHHSQISIRNKLNKYMFNEDKTALYCEDFLFLKSLIDKGHNAIYLNNALTRYRPSLRLQPD